MKKGACSLTSLCVNETHWRGEMKLKRERVSRIHNPGDTGKDHGGGLVIDSLNLVVSLLNDPSPSFYDRHKERTIRGGQ
jgi:hypothetical protein